MAKKSLDLKSFAGVVQSATQRTPDRNIKLNQIDIEKQVRTQFDDAEQAELDASVKAQGILQPVILLALPNGRYRLIAGERRVKSAQNNGLDEVPAVIKHNLEAWEIRRIQVAENADRADLTPLDEARGVQEDVDTYGVEMAMKIWNRSLGWISKRTSVAKFPDPIKRLIADRILGDLEIASSLNQLYQLDEQEYTRLDKRLRDDIPLSRDEIRGKVQQVKEWKDEEKQREERRKTLSKTAPNEKARPRPPATSTPVKPQPAPAKESATTVHAESGRSAAAVAAATHGDSATTGVDPANSNQVEQPSQQTESSTITSEQALVLDQMVTLFQNSVANHVLVKDVQKELDELGADRNQTEWAMWSLYQTIALPLLSALGEARAQRYLQRTVAELRTAKAHDLWNKLHPTVDGTQSDDWTTTRDPVAPMPKDWTF